jgi:hypothetical protein
MPQRFGISSFRPEIRSTVATGMQELEIGRLDIHEDTREA